MSQSSARVLVHAILLASSGCASIAVAQSYSIPEPPMRSTTDANGIDLAKGQFAISETDLSIGPQGAGGLAHTRFWSAQTSGSGWRHSYLLAIANRLNGLTINLGDHSVAFTGSGSNYTSDQSDGSQLTVADNIYTYTGRDGTIIIFDSSIIVQKARYYGPVIAVATAILKPDGEKQTLTYYQDGYDKPIPGDTIYTGLARLQSVTSTTGYQLYYSYASNNPNATDDWYRITQVTAINGAIDYCASTANPCASSGARVTYSTATSGSSTLETVVDPQGRTKVYTTDTSTRRMLAVQRPTGGSLTFGYGSDNRIATVSNGTANWSYVWSLSGTILTGTVTQPLSRQRIITADSTTNSVLTDRDGLGRTITHGYDASGRQTSLVAPEGNSLAFTYDARGNITQQTAVAKSGSGLTNISTTATFDPVCYNSKTCNQPNSTTDPRGNVTTYSYDPNHGGVVTLTSPAAQSGVHPQTRFNYSQLSAYYQTNAGLTAGAPIYKLTSTSTCQMGASCAGTADEVVSAVGYGTPGTPNTLLPTTTTKAAGDGSLIATTTMTYDYAGNIIASDGPLPGADDTTIYAYNADRQVTQVTSPDPDGSGPLRPRATQYGYDLDGQVTSVAVGAANSDGSSFNAFLLDTTTYDSLGRKVLDAAASGGTTYSATQYSYDVANRLDCVAVRMNPGAFGGVTAACAASGDGGFGPDRITRYGYDNADQVTTVTTGYGTPVARAETTSSYTPNGKVKTLADGKSNLTSYFYDGFDRLQKTEYPSGGDVGTSSTDDYEVLSYDAAGNVTSRRLRDGTSIGFGYDAFNQVTAKNVPVGTNSTTYVRDLLGRTTSTQQGSANVSFAYDALGRQIAEYQSFGSTTSQYDSAGRRIRLTWNDGFFVTYDYDNVGEMTAIRENGATSGAGVLATFVYDDLGHRLDLYRGNGIRTNYGYGSAQRLVSMAHLLPGAYLEYFQFGGYNPAGQIGNRTISNDAYAFAARYNVDRSYATNGLNQYMASGAVAPTYDTRGNLANAGGTAYTYWAENDLKAVTGGASATLYPDPYHRLVEYDTNVSTRFLYDGPNLIAEIANPPGAILKRYIHGPDADEPLVEYAGAGTTGKLWLHADERGSIVALSKPDGTGYAINSYDEYGIPAVGNYGRFQYTGQAWLSEIGLYNYKARTYSPTFGRFLQTDPIGYGNGLNIYNYVGSDPVNGTDPTGTVAEIVVIAAPYVFPTIQVVAGALATAVTSIFSGIFSIFGGGSPPPTAKECEYPTAKATAGRQNGMQFCSTVFCGRAKSGKGNWGLRNFSSEWISGNISLCLWSSLRHYC